MKYKIWSYEHNAWWKPNSFGYTQFDEQAGIYSEKDALRICENANMFLEELEINEIMVEVKDKNETI